MQYVDEIRCCRFLCHFLAFTFVHMKAYVACGICAYRAADHLIALCAKQNTDVIVPSSEKQVCHKVSACSWQVTDKIINDYEHMAYILWVLQFLGLLFLKKVFEHLFIIVIHNMTNGSASEWCAPLRGIMVIHIALRISRVTCKGGGLNEHIGFEGLFVRRKLKH